MDPADYTDPCSYLIVKRCALSTTILITFQEPPNRSRPAMFDCETDSKVFAFFKVVKSFTREVILFLFHILLLNPRFLS